MPSKAKSLRAIAPEIAESTSALAKRPSKRVSTSLPIGGIHQNAKKSKTSENSQADEEEPELSRATPKRKKQSRSTSRASSLSDKSDSDEEMEGSHQAGEDTYLKGFSSGSDSSDEDEDDDGVDSDAIDVAKLPTVAKDDATIKRKLDIAKQQPVCQFFPSPKFQVANI
jgi:nucleolar protein 15